MSPEKAHKLYLDEISLLGQEEFADYIQLNLRRIQNYRQNFDIPVIGIAGAEGKTTTMGMLSAILAPNFNLLKTPPDCSSTSGVTSTILKLDKSHEIALIELGIVNPEQFHWAARIAAPTIGVVTNIGESHLANLGNKYQIADAKIDLIKELPDDGFAILNIDDDLVSGMSRFAATSRIIKFGLNQNAHFYASNIRYLGPDGILFNINGYYPFHLPIYSSASIYNALTAASVARVLDIGFDEIKRGLEERFSLDKQRGNLIRRGDINILDYTYDATVNSVSKACESLVQFKPYSRELVLIIGDMSNAGPDVREAHLKMGYYIAALPIHTVFTVGEQARHIIDGITRLNHGNKRLVACKDVDQLTEKINAHLQSSSTLLFIGSKAPNLEQGLEKAVEKAAS